MERVTSVLIAISIALFIGIGIMGINFMSLMPVMPLMSLSNMMTLDKHIVNEGFKSVARASDCNCLPGYIPSTSGSGYNGKIYYFIREEKYKYYVFNPTGTNHMYLIPSEKSCGISVPPPSQPNPGYPYLPFSEIFGQGSKYNYKGQLPCEIVKEVESKSSYVCQSLTDPEKIRQCY